MCQFGALEMPQEQVVGSCTNKKGKLFNEPASVCLMLVVMTGLEKAKRKLAPRAGFEPAT